jgi:dolichyl-phosphate beta-glucosyltransferase
MFSAAAAEDLFNIQKLDGWSFDIEVLFIARKRGYAIAEIGIPWYFADFSHVSPVRDALRMVVDILTMWLNHFSGIYRRKKDAPQIT